MVSQDNLWHERNEQEQNFGEEQFATAKEQDFRKSQIASRTTAKTQSTLKHPIFRSLILQGHVGSVLSVAFSSDGRTIVSGSDDRTIRLWSSDGKPVGQPFQGHVYRISSVAFSPDVKTIASGSDDKTIQLWSLDGKPVGQPLREHNGSVMSVAFSPDGKTIVSGSFDHTIRLWSLDGKPVGQPLQGHDGPVRSVAFSPDGKTIVSGSFDHTIRLWSLDGKPVGQPLRGHDGRVRSVAFSPDGKTIISGSDDHTIRLWSLDGKPVGQPLRGHDGRVRSVAFSPDGKTIVSGSEDQTIRLWSLDGKPMGQPLRGHDGRVRSVAFSPDGKTIVSGSDDQTIRLWYEQHTTLVPASITNDLPQGNDNLQIQDELTALATVLMLRQLKPPIAVGILGSWGSGKSFAMHLIRQQINTIRSQSLSHLQAWGDQSDDNYEKKLSPYVGHIYQIEFNAWTYARADLWASLMQEIFYELNRQLTLERQLKTALENSGSKQSLLEGGTFWKALYSMRLRDHQELLENELGSRVLQELKKVKNDPDATEGILWSALGKLRKQERKDLQKTETLLKKEQAELDAKQKQIEQEFELKKRKQSKIARARALKARLALLFLELLQVRERDEKLPPTSWQANLALRIFRLPTEQEKESTASTTSDAQNPSSDLDKETAEKSVQVELDSFLKEIKALTGTGQITPFRLTRWIKQNWLICILFIASICILSSAIQDLPELLNHGSPDWVHRFWKLLGGLVLLLPTGLKISTRISQWIKDYQTSVQIQLERIQKQQEADQADRLEAEEIIQKNATINKLTIQAEQLRKKIGLTANYDSLVSLVKERLDSKTYSDHLGLMEQVRQDLLDLSDRLTSLPKDMDSLEIFKQYFPRGPVRVVLYIDDLDRCPPNRVVEVLETVQLLLKTELFVVILATDDRYIARALEQCYSGVLKRRGKPSGIDYLEKIIQIPYRMRPISPINVESYLDAQTQPRKKVEPESPTSPATSTLVQNQSISERTQLGNTDNELEATPEGRDMLPSTEAAEPSSNLETIAEVTEFEEWEFQLLVNCCKHVDITPRTAKRLINIYKILKIVWEKRPVPIDQPEQERERIAIAMLALSGRYPDFMRSFFEELATKFEEEADLSEKIPQLLVSLYKITQILKPQIPTRDYFAQQEWRRFISDLKRTLLSLAPEDQKLSLEELSERNNNLETFRIDYETFHLALSFCFVGDIGYDPDDYSLLESQELSDGENSRKQPSTTHE